MPSEFVQQLDDMARDFAAMLHGGDNPSDRRVRMAREGSGISGKLHAVETLSVRKTDRFASDAPSNRRLKFPIPDGVFRAALSQVGTSLQRIRSDSHLKKLDFSLRTLAFIAAPIIVAATLAWQFHSVSTTKSPNVNVVAGQTVFTLAGQASTQNPPQQSAAVTQSKPAPAATAAAPEVVQQLGNIVRDLAVLRDSIERLAAKQEQATQTVATLQVAVAKQEQTAQTLQELAAKQEQTAQTLQELAAKQEQAAQTLQDLSAKQQQMAQNIAMLQAGAETEQGEEGIKPKFSPPQSSRAAPLPRPRKVPLVAPKQSAAQSAPRLAPVRLPFLDASP
jgi:chemotaxis protein histidine kinase CheA